MRVRIAAGRIAAGILLASCAGLASAQKPDAGPATAASVPDWRPLGSSQGVAISWDAAAIERGETVIVSVRFMPPVPGATPYAYSVSRVELRCAAGEAHTILTTNYYPDGSAGHIDTVPAPIIAIQPRSFFDILRRLAC